MEKMIFEILAQNGLSFTMLALAVWYFHDKNKKIEERQEQLHKEMLTMILSELEKTRTIIERNTHAFEEMTDYIRNNTFKK